MAVLFGLPLGRFVSAGSDGARPEPASLVAGSAAGDVARLEEAVAANPGSSRALADLGLASLERFRETADPKWLGRSAEALSRAERIDPLDVGTLSGLGAVSLAKHEFEEALQIGRRAQEAHPDSVEPLAVIVDALIELGRYPEAIDVADEMSALKPGLTSYARVSYLRELHGDHDGAIDSMGQALAAASSPGDIAYIGNLMGELHLEVGDLDRAEAAYDRVLIVSENDPAARAGLASVAAARGDLDEARTLLESSTRRLPEPGSISLLGDVLAADGDRRGAQVQYERVRSIEELNRSNGIEVDLELAIFEAGRARDDGGRPSDAVDLGRRALAARPTVFAQDALGWALRQAGQPAEALPHAREAVKLGTRHADLWWHLAAIEADLGMKAEAAANLAKAFAMNPYLTVGDLPEARALAQSLGVPLPARGK